MRTPKERIIILKNRNEESRPDSKETEALFIKVSYVAHSNGKKIKVPLHASPFTSDLSAKAIIGEGQYAYICVQPVINFFSNRLFFTVCKHEYLSNSPFQLPLIIVCSPGYTLSSYILKVQPTFIL